MSNNASYKNQLQEIFQKQQLPLPVYDTVRLPDYADHTPMWQSSLEILNSKFIGSGTSKKQAEINAAKLAFQNINHQNINNRLNEFKQKCNYEDIVFPWQTGDNDSGRVILVDGENYNFKYFSADPNDVFLIFVARNTTKNVVFELQDKHEHVYVYISQMVGKDAADHMLTFFAGKLSMDERINKDITFRVLTKDHFGEYLESFMSKCVWKPN